MILSPADLDWFSGDGLYNLHHRKHTVIRYRVYKTRRPKTTDIPPPQPGSSQEETKEEELKVSKFRVGRTNIFAPKRFNIDTPCFGILSPRSDCPNPE